MNGVEETGGVINRGMSRLITQGPFLVRPPLTGAFIGFLESMNEDKKGGDEEVVPPSGRGFNEYSPP